MNTLFYDTPGPLGYRYDCPRLRLCSRRFSRPCRGANANFRCRSPARTSATVREAAFNDGALRPFQRRTAALQGFRGVHVRPPSIADALMDGRTRNEFLPFFCIESNARLVRLQYNLLSLFRDPPPSLRADRKVSVSISNPTTTLRSTRHDRVAFFNIDSARAISVISKI